MILTIADLECNLGRVQAGDHVLASHRLVAEWNRVAHAYARLNATVRNAEATVEADVDETDLWSTSLCYDWLVERRAAGRLVLTTQAIAWLRGHPDTVRLVWEIEVEEPAVAVPVGGQPAEVQSAAKATELMNYDLQGKKIQ